MASPSSRICPAQISSGYRTTKYESSTGKIRKKIRKLDILSSVRINNKYIKHLQLIYMRTFVGTLKYPERLHEEHASYPLAPEQFTVTEDMMSEYQKTFLKKFGICGSPWKNDGNYESCGKLGANFNDRIDYVVHYMNLQLYLRLGMELVSIRRAFKFKQKPWIREYVETKTRQRAAAKSKFKQEQKKFEVNALFGKLMQCMRKMLSVKFAVNYKQAARYLSRYFCDFWRIVGENSAVFFTKKKSFKQDRPLFVGFATLELSKYRMFDLFYNYIRKEFPRSEVVLTDTDSLLLSIDGVSKLEFYRRMAHVMDLSNLPNTHPHFSLDNKKRPGYLKDELGGVQIGEVCALKAKCYSYVSTDKRLRAVKCKGIKKAKAWNNLSFKAFKQCLHNLKEFRVSSCRLQSKQYEMHMIYTRKIALSSLDLKRYIMPCGIHTLPYFSREIKKVKKTLKCTICNYSESEMINALA